MMIQLNESAITEFLIPMRNVFGKDVRVNVNGKKSHFQKFKDSIPIAIGSAIQRFKDFASDSSNSIFEFLNL